MFRVAARNRGEGKAVRRHPILIVSDEADLLDSLRRTLEGDHEVWMASSGPEGLEILRREAVAAMILDPRMQEMNGAGFLDQAAPLAPKARILLRGHTDTEPLIGAVNSGRIYGHLAQPWKPEELRLNVRRAVESYEMAVELEERQAEILQLSRELEEARQRLEQEKGPLRQTGRPHHRFEGPIGRSRAMRRVYDLIEKVLHSDVAVLLTGETGTGKDLLARYIHANGPWRKGPWVAQNCGALPSELLESELFGHRKGSFTGATEDRPGLFKAADGGTIYLDEISEASPAVQVRLLRVLQDGEVRRVGETLSKKVNVRVIAATNRDLQAEVKAGRFREDLYFRLNVFSIEVPPLRERPEDVPPLAVHFLKRFAPNPQVQFTPEAMDLLCRYAWPGNVRELKNEVQRALLLIGSGERIGPEVLSEPVRGEPAHPRETWREGPLSASIAQLEQERIAEALKRCEGNRTHAARELGMSRWGLVQKIKKYGIEAD